MPKVSNHRIALKPQDLYMLPALLGRPGADVASRQGHGARTGARVALPLSSVPEAALKDARLYAALPLLDALPGYHQLKGEFSERGFDRELRGYLTERCGAWLARLAFDDALTGMFVPDEALAERAQTVLRRLTLLARAA